MTTLIHTTSLVVTSCWCGVAHAIPESLMRQANENGHSVYCPLGHEWVVTESEVERLNKRLKSERERAARLAAERDQTQASLAATKGHLTRQKKRAAAGVCPCCNRTFKQLAAHMANKHPDYLDQPA